MVGVSLLMKPSVFQRLITGAVCADARGDVNGGWNKSAATQLEVTVVSKHITYFTYKSGQFGIHELNRVFEKMHKSF